MLSVLGSTLSLDTVFSNFERRVRRAGSNAAGALVGLVCARATAAAVRQVKVRKIQLSRLRMADMVADRRRGVKVWRRVEASAAGG
jgi:hypothetical protein